MTAAPPYPALMKLNLPKGYEPPENAQPGQPFEAVATLSMEEDGTFELVAIDGMDLEGDMGDDEEEAPELPWNKESQLE